MTKKTKNYHHGDLKAALIRAGLEILEESGLEGLSLRAIAARVGVSHTAPKNHFDGINGLLTAIAAEGFRRHAREMQLGVADAPRGAARLEAACLGYVRFARNHPALFSLMFSPHLKNFDDPELRDASQESYSVLEEISRGLVWPRRATHEPEACEELRTQVMLWTFVHGYASLFNEGSIPCSEEGTPLLGVLDVMPEFKYAFEQTETS